jgi:hypothetical protein
MSLAQNITSKFIVDSERSVEIEGTLEFSVKSILNYEYLEGDVTYRLTDGQRQKIAALSGEDVSMVASLVEEKSVFADLQKDTKCADFQIRLKPFEAHLNQSKVQFQQATIKLNFEKNSEELGKLFCRWLYDIRRQGSHTYRTTRRINAILQGKEI